MMQSTTPKHSCQVIASPWQGIYCTLIDSARTYGKHWHDTYGLGLLDDGAQRSASGRGQVDAYAGDLIATNPGEVHDGRPIHGASRRWRMVYMDAEAMSLMAPDLKSSPGADREVAHPVIQDIALRRAMQWLFTLLERWNALQGVDSATELACEESLVMVCAQLLNRHGNLRPIREQAQADMNQVRERLAEELLEPPTLTALATMAGLSKYQLLRQFEKCYGMPPHAWLLSQRVARARRFIRDGLSLTQAAAACGFADQSHMTRFFVRQFGFTPGAWQKASIPAL